MLSSAATIWPLVMELKSHQVPFWGALRAYVGVVFHPRLLLECSTDPDVLELQTKVRKWRHAQFGVPCTGV